MGAIEMALRENISQEPVSELTLRPLVLFEPDRPVSDACESMRHGGVGAAIAVDPVGRPVGMFNEKVLIRLLASNPDAIDEPAEKYMVRNVVVMNVTDPIAELIATMKQRHLRWVCVVDEQGKATAVAGLRGVMEYIVDHHPLLVKSTPIRRKLSMTEREGA
jgi:CBS domain-containing protein